MQKKIGKFIRSLRREQKLTQGKLSEQTGLSIDTIGRIERGAFSPSVRTLGKILDSLKITFTDFFYPVQSQRANKIIYYVISLLNEMNDKELVVAGKILEALTEDDKEERSREWITG